MKNVIGIIAGFILVSAIIFLVSRLGSESEAKTEAQLRADSLAAELAGERLASEGWEVRFTETEDSLLALVASQGEDFEIVSRELEAARIQIRSLTRTLAQGGDTVVDTVFIRSDSTWGGEIDDGLLRAQWSLDPIPGIFRMPYTVTVEQEFVQGVTGDGRGMITARALDPRVELSVTEFAYSIPTPVVISKCGWGERLRWLGGGLAVGTGFGISLPF